MIHQSHSDVHSKQLLLNNHLFDSFPGMAMEPILSAMKPLLSELKSILTLKYYLVVNLITFLVYATDKSQARGGGSRVPERILFILALVGGPYGALVGMGVSHHKTSKPHFWLINGFLAWIHWSQVWECVRLIF